MPIDALPTELLSHIFSLLSGPAPSDARLHDQPSPALFTADPTRPQPLKAVSLVSRRWRLTVLPLLFRHVVWVFDRWDLLLVGERGKEEERGEDLVDALPPLAFLHSHDLGRYVDTMTLVVRDSMHGMYRLPEAGRAPDTSSPPPSRGPSTSRPIALAPFSRGPDRETLERSHAEDNNWLWSLLFRVADPRRFTMVASPRMLASLLSRMLFLGDAWSFRNPCHVLSLERGGVPQESAAPSSSNTDTSSTEHASSSTTGCHTPRRIPCALFTIRPWTSLLLNEGSSTGVYKTYEFFLKRPPSILGALLGCEEAPNDEPMVPASVRSLDYVAVFPLSSHFSSLVRHLPRLDRLFVQLVPRGADAALLDDPDVMRNIEPSDMWMERNTCYSLIMRELLDHDDSDSDDERQTNHWHTLRRFESGDAADKEAWDMAVQYVESSPSPWHVESEGVFVKGERGSDDGRELSAPAFYLLSVGTPTLLSIDQLIRLARDS